MAQVIRVIGLKKLKKALKTASRRMQSATIAALFTEATSVMDLSQTLVPVATGELKGSAFVTKPTIANPNSVTGYSAGHAVKIHEDLTIPHSNGQAKYLEAALNKRSGGAAKRIAANTKRNFEKKIGIRSVRAKYSTNPNL